MLIGKMPTFRVGFPTLINPVNKFLIGNRHAHSQLNLDNVSLPTENLFPIYCVKSATTMGMFSVSMGHLNSTTSSPDLELWHQLGSNQTGTPILELIKSMCRIKQMLALSLLLPLKKQPLSCYTLKMCRYVATRNKPPLLNSTKDYQR